MKETAQETLQYLQENLLISVVIAFVAGFAAYKTVVHSKKTNPALFFIVGLLGSFLGQFAIRYLGIKEVLDQVSAFQLFFDFFAAYIGSFVVATIYNFIKPL